MAQRSLHVHAIWRRRLRARHRVLRSGSPCASAPTSRSRYAASMTSCAPTCSRYLSFDRYRKSEVPERPTRSSASTTASSAKWPPRSSPSVTTSRRRKSELQDLGGGNWRVNVNDRARARRCSWTSVDVRVSGPGANDVLFTRVRRNLPLKPGRAAEPHRRTRRSRATSSARPRTTATLDARMTKSELLVDPPRPARPSADARTGDGPALPLRNTNDRAGRRSTTRSSADTCGTSRTSPST